jgi:hypothetical protein
MAAKKPSFVPMIILIVLSFLNVVAAGFLLYYVGVDARLRLLWTQVIDQRIEQRDGLATDKLIAQLTNDEKDKIKKWEAEWSKRQSAVGARLNQLKERPDLINSEDSKKTAKEYGAEDYRRVLRLHVRERAHELRGEEQRLTEEKNTLLQVRSKYDERIRRLQEEITRVATDDKKIEELLTKEKDIQDKLGVENQERRREIAGLYAEVEEAAAARDLADGTLNDYKRRRDAIRKRSAELIKENLALEQEIRKFERVPEPTVPTEPTPAAPKTPDTKTNGQ